MAAPAWRRLAGMENSDIYGVRKMLLRNRPRMAEK
jgi:hypothetical protein